MSTTTNNYKLIKTDLTDAADITSSNENWDVVDQQLALANKVFIAHSEDGVAYVANIDGVSELYDGLEIKLLPDMTSTQVAVTLNVNGLGDKNIRFSKSYENSGELPAKAGWLVANKPITMYYNSSANMWLTESVDLVTAKQLFNNSYEVVQSYPSKAGLFALNGTDIFANMPNHNSIGVLFIAGAYNGLNIYIDNTNRLYYGFSDGIKEPSAWHRPVQLGGGSGQGSNTIMLGWDGSYLKAQVDTVDLGSILTHRNLSYSNGTLNIETRQNA